MYRLSSMVAVGVLCLAAVSGVTAAQSTAVTATASDAAAGGTVTVTFTVENTATEASSAIVNVTALPEGWGIENRTDAGGFWNGGEHKWLYQSVPAGETVAPSLTLSIPADASGSYDVAAYATDDPSVSDNRTAATATVTVGEESDTATDGPTDTATGGSGPGLTAAGAVAALVGATLLARRRR